ncbi:MAG: FRG domain-containing protein [Actinomycetota bacterium]|nr:FRG domain-containing protein [Actinomycetota bacterium]
MNLAERVLSEREVRPPSLDALFNATKNSSYLVERMKAWFDRSDLPGRPSVEMRYRFRGHADSSWGLSSTLYRTLITVGGDFDEAAFSRAERAVLRQMRLEGLGRNMSDGELLMVLQHHAAPTRLIDTTYAPRVALYFAVSAQDRTDGRLFVVGQRKASSGRYPSTRLGDSKELPWKAGGAKGLFTPALWRESVVSVDDPPLDPRIVAQRGRFLVGGMIRRLAGDGLSLDGQNLSAEELRHITTLRIMFPLKGAKKPAGSKWPAVGWTIRVPAEWKAELRVRLGASGVTTDHLFPDYDGCRRLAAYVAIQAASAYSSLDRPKGARAAAQVLAAGRAWAEAPPQRSK